nr:MAG TPA: hypothetical protein [Caudoviricetes sp.]
MQRLRAFGKIPFEHLTLNSYVKRFPKPLKGLLSCAVFV